MQQAQAGFIDDYTLSNFTLINTRGDGSAVVMDGGLTLVLTGPNTGSGLAGTTELVTTATATGQVLFQYLYSSLELEDGYDAAGYLIGNTLTQLADTDGDSGTVSFDIVMGQTFGFWVSTLDNTGEPGIITIFDFSAPGSGADPVPEPGTLSLLLVASGAAVIVGRARIRSRLKEKNS